MVEVQNVNMPPEILAISPTQDTTLAAGQNVLFWVDARDPDGDTVHYLWKVDGVVKGSDSPIFEHFINKYFIGNMTIDVFVNDGFAVTSHRWIVDVTTAVEIAEFMAWFDEQKMSVVIRWLTSHERDNVGFHVYRSLSENGEYVKITEELIPSQEDGHYSIMDKSVRVGQTYYYRLRNIDALGIEREFGPIKIEVPVPQKFVLGQNYPNPFNPVTTIRYQIPKRDRVSLTIYNMMGQQVITLMDEDQDPGYYVAEWDGRDESGHEASTGIYIYQLRTNHQTLTRRMIKIR